MIEPLLREVERLRAVMAEHREYLSMTEAATRYALIDPVLRLLGWDVHDAAVVKPEYRSGAARTSYVDYALLRDGRIAALIEAKSLGTTLADAELEQLSNYCVNCRPTSVQWGILTNGDEWRLLDTFNVRQSLAKRVVLAFKTSSGPALTALHSLISLFGLVAGHVDEVASTAAVETRIRPSRGGAQKAGSGFALPELVPRVAGLKKPRITLRFPDGEEAEAKSWAAVLRSVLEWLQEVGKLTAQQCPFPDAAGRRRYLVHTEPRHADGRPFTRGGERLSNGLYYHTKYDRADCVANALHILRSVGVDPETVRWWVPA